MGITKLRDFLCGVSLLIWETRGRSFISPFPDEYYTFELSVCLLFLGKFCEFRGESAGRSFFCVILLILAIVCFGVFGFGVPNV